MAEVEQFDVTIELMPLLQGEIRVVSMRLQRPHVRVRVDERGDVDWFRRGAASQALDVDKVVLESVDVEDGTLTYSDDRSGFSRTLAGVRAKVSARALSGPWKVEDASYLEDGRRVQFSLATGRRLEDGSIRIKADVQPSQWPIDISADGKIDVDAAEGLVFDGTYNVRQIDVSSARARADDTGWRSEGSFRLTGEQLLIDRAILTSGPPDRPSSLAGTLEMNFGEVPSFSATAEANQIDLDRSLGAGPAEPFDVRDMAGIATAWLRDLPRPTMPGDITLRVPVIVVGGSIIQDFGLVATVVDSGWRVSDLKARLPGQASIALDGVVEIDDEIGYRGDARLTVLQPATFAGWWRGSASGEGASERLLSAFDLQGRAVIGPGRVSFDNVQARIGAAEITGQIDWGESRVDGHRSLGTDLVADRIDLAQLRALAELLSGRELGSSDGLVDDYQIRLATDEFTTDDVVVRDVVVDAAFTGDVLTVIQLTIGDLGGASYRVTRGQIKGFTTSNPSGVLEGKLEAHNLDGLARLVRQWAPESEIADWLERSAPSLVPAFIATHITAPPEEGGTGMRIALDGVAGPTTMSVRVDATMDPSRWREDRVRVDLILDSPDSVSLLRQFGLDASVHGALDPPAHIEVQARGRPVSGIQTTLIADIAGVISNATGSVRFDDESRPSFTGTLGLTSDNIDTAVALAGLAIPGAALGTNLELENASVEADSDRIAVNWRNAGLADRNVGGDLAWLKDPALGWRVEGALTVDEVDLPWIAAVGLGFAPLPTSDPDAPWSPARFSAPYFGEVNGLITIDTDHFYVSDAVDVVNARLTTRLRPQRIDVNLNGGEVAGGRVAGNLSIHNVDGNANVAGGFDLRGAALESFVWQRDNRAIASGTMDFSTTFESTGRSPAGLIASLTGGGAINIAEGEVLYINPNAARPIIRESDVGQEFTEDSLRELVVNTLDADSLAFGSAETAFTIAAGTLRLKNLELAADNFSAIGDGVLDLNSMTLDSDWTLSFEPNDDKVQGTIPKAGLVFRGPIASPERFVDVLPFDSYLNMRLEARMLEIIELEQATRLENERWRRLLKMYEQEAERRERERLAAAEAERLRKAAAIAGFADLIALRETRAERAAQRRLADAEASAAIAEAAVAQATDNAERLASEAETLRVAAAAALADLEQLRQVEADGQALAEDLATGQAQAQAALAASAQVQAEAQSQRDAAEAAVEAARQASDAAAEVAGAAAGSLQQATAERDAAGTVVLATQEAVSLGRTSAEEAAEALALAETTLNEATAVHEAAVAAAATARADLTEAEAALASASAASTTATETAERAAADLTRAEQAAGAATAKLGADIATQEAALQAAEAASGEHQAAQARADTAAGAIDLAIELGGQMTGSDTASEADRRLAAEMETRARTLAVGAAEAAATARDADAVAQAALAEATTVREASQAESDAANEVLAEAVAATALAQSEAAAAQAALESAEATVGRLTTARDAAAAEEVSATTELETARLAHDGADQSASDAVGHITGVLVEAQSAATAASEAEAAHELASAAAQAAGAEAARARAVLVEAGEVLSAAEQALRDAISANAEAAQALDAAALAHSSARSDLEAAVAARETAEVAVASSLESAEAAEANSASVAARVEDLTAIADRARAFADWIATGGSRFDAPATFESAILIDPVEADTQTAVADGLVDDPDGDQAGTATGGSEQAVVIPPAPKLRPQRPLAITPQATTQ